VHLPGDFRRYLHGHVPLYTDHPGQVSLLRFALIAFGNFRLPILHAPLPFLDAARPMAQRRTRMEPAETVGQRQIEKAEVDERRGRIGQSHKQQAYGRFLSFSVIFPSFLSSKCLSFFFHQTVITVFPLNMFFHQYHIVVHIVYNCFIVLYTFPIKYGYNSRIYF
jgi:hypothetical protein